MDIPTLDPATLGFLALVAAVCGMFLWGAAAAGNGRAALTAAMVLALWLIYTGLMAGKGLLLDPEAVPPPMALILFPGLILAGAAAFTGFGGRMAKHLGYASLVGFHAFRLPLEGLLWWFYRQGRLPVQMTFEGRNPDILTGISAVILAVLLKRGAAGRKAVMIWNLCGFALLINIVTVAILSLPGRMRAFHNEPANTLVLYFPYVWLPAVLVLGALLGHLLVFRKLRLMQP
ncbi:MAG: hypothetical protein JWP91_2414 [Fibrobacteres bacterium]|nr:hypothetical protein [Fibrobacterota bacterium]